MKNIWWGGSMWVPAASFLLAVGLCVAAGGGGRSGLVRAAMDVTLPDGACRGDVHAKNETPEVTVGDRKYKFGRDITAAGAICRFNGFGIKMASVAGNESNAVVLFSQRKELYSVAFNGLYVNGARVASLAGNVGKNRIGQRSVGAGAEGLTFDNSLTAEVEVSVDPIFSKQIELVRGRKVNAQVKVPISVKPEVTLDTKLQITFPGEGVDAVGLGEGMTALASTVTLPVSQGIPLAQGGLLGIGVRVEAEITGELKYSNTKYTLDAHPRPTALNGSAKSIFGGLDFKLGGKVNIVVSVFGGELPFTIFPEGEFFSHTLEGSTKDLY